MAGRGASKRGAGERGPAKRRAARGVTGPSWKEWLWALGVLLALVFLVAGRTIWRLLTP